MRPDLPLVEAVAALIETDLSAHRCSVATPWTLLRRLRDLRADHGDDNGAWTNDIDDAWLAAAAGGGVGQPGGQDECEVGGEWGSFPSTTGN